MEITIHIPDHLAERLGTAAELPRRMLEALAIEEFRLGHLIGAELRRLLGFSTRAALDALLKAHNIYLDYGMDDFQRDREDLRRVGF